MTKIHPKHTTKVMAFFMSLIMSIVISVGVTLFNEGLTLHALHDWPREWIESWIIALPVAIVVLPQVRRIATYLTTDTIEKKA